VKPWLSPAGTASALAVGAAVWFGTGWRGLVVLAVFLATASALTPGGGRRRPVQVFANGGVAALCALLARTDGAFALAFAGAVAAATADTWSTEIGGRGRAVPRSITTGRPVARGASGGITLAGTAGGLLGAGLIGLISWLVGLASPSGMLCVVAAGAAGTLTDSFLGASVQARWRCTACGATIEVPVHGCGGAPEPLSGWRWLDNHAVNAVATLVGAAVAALPVFPAGAPLP
jgi:uncharacterized protein (TIGR00297 family)